MIRGGTERRIPARELVPGDLILVGEGERLPADGLLIAGDALTVDESALTGESVPVSKRPAPTEMDEAGDPEPGGDDTPYLFAGTLNVRGQGMVHVVRTGASTRLGRIGASLAAIEDEPTLLQKTTGALIAKLGILALAFCAIVAVAYGVLRDDWIGGALSGITLAIALLPEEFPMVLAIFMALGAFRLARHKVLVRRAAVIETLGAATFLCVDKTGTLTENRMVLTTTWRDGKVQDLQDSGGLPAAPCEPLRTAATRFCRPPRRSHGPGRPRIGCGFRRAGQGRGPAAHLSAPSRASGVHPGLAGPGGRRSVCRERRAGGDFPSLPHER